MVLLTESMGFLDGATIGLSSSKIEKVALDDNL
jgi:hypothetical protein